VARLLSIAELSLDPGAVLAVAVADDASFHLRVRKPALVTVYLAGGGPPLVVSCAHHAEAAALAQRIVNAVNGAGH
jgi:hypothetical protein